MNRKCLRIAVLGLSVLLAAATPLAVAAAASGASSASALGTAKAAAVLRGRFVQHKHLAGLDHPLVSSGNYVVAKGHGLLWNVEQPVSSQLVITPDALTEHTGGQQTTRISTDQQPALSAVASVLLAVFQGNTTQLSHYFEMKQAARQPDTGTRVILTPKIQAVRQIVSQLTLTTRAGAIRHIRINRPNGDYSVIDLKPDTDANAPLSPAEQRAFAH